MNYGLAPLNDYNCTRLSFITLSLSQSWPRGGADVVQLGEAQFFTFRCAPDLIDFPEKRRTAMTSLTLRYAINGHGIARR
jgi:hypothetical protein